MPDINQQCAEIVCKTQKVLAEYLTSTTISKQDVINSLFGIYDGPEHRDTVNTVMKREAVPA